MATQHICHECRHKRDELDMREVWLSDGEYRLWMTGAPGQRRLWLCDRCFKRARRKQAEEAREAARPVKKKRQAGKKKKADRPRPGRKGERLLITCAPIVSDYVMRDLAETLHGSVLTDPDGRIWQVVAVRIDGRRVFGHCQEMYEAAPFMFAPVTNEEHMPRLILLDQS